MNTVPLLFTESVAQSLAYGSLCSLNDLTSGVFAEVGRSLSEKRIYITIHVVYYPEASSFNYCIAFTRYPQGDPYTFDPADAHFVREFGVNVRENKGFLRHEATWTTTTLPDPTLLKWLSAPVAQAELNLYVNCHEFLKLLPDYCTFNRIYAFSAYNDALDAIIQRSQDCGRLESVTCKEFFQKRQENEAAEWISTNDRLKQISFVILRQILTTL